MITYKMKKALEPLIDAFKYRRDTDLYGTREFWTTMPISRIMEGDCEDFSLTILKSLAGNTKFGMFKLLFSREAKLHYVRVPIKGGGSEGHCVLEYNGYFVDNNFRTWVSKEDMLRRGSYRFRYRYILPLIAFNYLWSKVITFKNNKLA